MGVKDALAEKTGNKGEVKLTKSMSIADMIKAMKPEIEKGLCRGAGRGADGRALGEGLSDALRKPFPR